jgi:glycosidase
MEFHVRRLVREELGLEESLFELSGNIILPNFLSARILAQRLNLRVEAALRPERAIKAGQLNAMGLIDEILHYVCGLYRQQIGQDVFARALKAVQNSLGRDKADSLLLGFVEEFPPLAVYRGQTAPAAYLAGSSAGRSHREMALEELLMLWLANDNPAFGPFRELFDDTALRARPAYLQAINALRDFFAGQPGFGPDGQPLVDLLKSPAVEVPHSLPGQLDYIRRKWGLLLGPYLRRLLSSLDLVKEEAKAFFPGPGPSRVLAYEGLEKEYERFSPDQDWMPRVVMIAKSTLVWLHQLSRQYGRPITRLDQIPDEELDLLASRGFTALWLIGVWERSGASERIKRICGNPEAAASAYSVFDYEIAAELGGWSALADLRQRAAYRGLRLAADMVPNHTGMDSRWIRERPDFFIQSRSCPFPGYSFTGENLSSHPDIGLFLEDHYYSRTDAAVVFKRVDFRDGDVRYIYHGNDGTSMPWNDTAQIDFLNPQARRAVKDTILNVARNFPIIRFDAAMVLAKRHIRRLWYPEPGSGGDVPSRAEHALAREDFDRALPEEFWREVVDECAAQAGDTLLLAEAFWMLEGYFVRTLGMHRVYNSAFMNMLKREENAKYRATIRNTLEFDPDILKRFVNFLNNPDEETAVAQFGKGDKYFGVCSMMVTMPGLPMFGHGQVEGFEEKYGMEYRRSYWNESPDPDLVERHEREIFPLMKKRYIFASAETFLLYDLISDDGTANENVFAYSNRQGGEAALVLYNNAFARAWGRLKDSAPFALKAADGSKSVIRRSLADGLGLAPPQAGQQRFCILREQRSGLWFIRSSAAIRAEGLFAALDGYQCQVFLDIGEVIDNALGQYAKLCAHLDGRGVVDLSETMREIFLKDLYEALDSFASPDFFAGMRDLLSRALGLSAEVDSEADAGPAQALQEPAMSADPEKANILEGSGNPDAFLNARRSAHSVFFQTAVRFLEGTSEYDAFSAESPVELATADEAFDTFAAMTRNLLDLAGIIGSARDSGGLLAWLGEGFRRDPGLMDLASAFLVLADLRCVIGHGSSCQDLRRLIEHWGLDSRLAGAILRSAPPGGSVRNPRSLERGLAAIKAILPYLDQPFMQGKASPADRALAIFRACGADQAVRAFLGVNEYQGRLWFVKESMEEFLWFSFLVIALNRHDTQTAGPQVPQPLEGAQPVKGSKLPRSARDKPSTKAAASEAMPVPMAKPATKTSPGLRGASRLPTAPMGPEAMAARLQSLDEIHAVFLEAIARSDFDYRELAKNLTILARLAGGGAETASDRRP